MIRWARPPGRRRIRRTARRLVTFVASIALALLATGCDGPIRPSQLPTWLEALPPVPEPAQLDQADRSVREGFATRRAALEEALSLARERDATDASDATEDRPPFPGTDVHRVAMAFGSLGDFALAYREWHTARVAYQNATSLEPKDARWLFLLGVVHQGLGEIEPALASYEQALELDPVNPEILLQWAELRLEDDRREGVQERLERVLAQRPDHPVALQLLARVQAADGDPEAAIASLRRAHQAAPYAADIRYTLSQLLRDGGEMDEAAALLDGVDVGGEGRVARVPRPWLDRVRALQRGVRRLQREGEAAYRADRLPEALERFTEAAELAPENPLPQLNRMLVLVDLGRFDDAEAQRERLRELAPDHRQLLYLSARIEAARGDLAAAMRELRRAIEVDPGFTPPRAELARIAYRSGDLEEGREQFRMARMLEPESDAHRLHLLLAEAIHGDVERACAVVEESASGTISMTLGVGAVRLMAIAPDGCGREQAWVRSLARQLYRRDDSIFNAESLAIVDSAHGRHGEAVRIGAQVVEQLEQRVNAGRVRFRADLDRARARLESYRARRLPRPIWTEEELQTLGFLRADPPPELDRNDPDVLESEVDDVD